MQDLRYDPHEADTLSAIQDWPVSIPVLESSRKNSQPALIQPEKQRELQSLDTTSRRLLLLFHSVVGYTGASPPSCSYSAQRRCYGNP